VVVEGLGSNMPRRDKRRLASRAAVGEALIFPFAMIIYTI
jgi:hypothetical protein